MLIKSEAPGAVDFKEVSYAVPLRETHPDASRALRLSVHKSGGVFSCLQRQAGPGETDKDCSKTGGPPEGDHDPSKTNGQTATFIPTVDPVLQCGNANITMPNS